LYRIASNTCLSRKRKQSKQVVQPTVLENLTSHDSGLYDSTIAVSDWSNDPLANTLNDELRDELDEAITELPEQYRMVFLMRDIEGMSGDETAAALQITTTNVKVRLHRARMFLRNKLETYVKTAKEG